GGIQSRETGEINSGLCLASAFEDAARAGAEWEHMSRPREVLRITGWINGGPDCVRPIVGRNASGDTGAPRINRDRERRAAQRGVNCSRVTAVLFVVIGIQYSPSL